MNFLKKTLLILAVAGLLSGVGLSAHRTFVSAQAEDFDGFTNVENDGSTNASSPSNGSATDASQEEVVTTEEQATCETTPGNVFGWIFCPFLALADSAFERLYEFVEELLITNPEYYRNDGIRRVWSNIRNIALVLLVVIMLVMVIGTAAGTQMLDAYTVKRAMPRLVVAIIFIMLSYEICALFIDVMNDITRGIAGIIESPFINPETNNDGKLGLDDVFGGGNAEEVAGVGVGIVIAGLGAAAFLSFVSLGVIGSFLLGAAGFLLVTYIVLIARLMVIVGLIVFAPLAILSWIFPGNDKLWKLWYESFTKALYLQIIIVAVLKFGLVFAQIINEADSGVVPTILKLGAIIVSIVAIPGLAKFAGSAVGNLVGMANDRSKGLFDRNKKWRGDKMKHNWNETRAGERFKKNCGRIELSLIHI